MSNLNPKLKTLKKSYYVKAYTNLNLLFYALQHLFDEFGNLLRVMRFGDFLRW